MEFAVSAASWVVGKALGPVTDSLLEAWAASKGLGPNMDALKMELLYAQAMLDNAQGREIHSPALKELLNKLRQLAYKADDVLDELDYFRIQDALDGTYHTTDEHAGGCVKNLVLNASQTARDAVAKLKPSSGSRGKIRGEPDEQDNNSAKQRCSCVCPCGGRTVTSSPLSPTNQQDDQKVNGDGNGRLFFCGTFLCGKREMSSSTPSTTSQGDKKLGCGCMLKVTSAACNTAKSIGKCLPCCSFQSVDENAHTGMSENPNMPVNKKKLLCGAWRSKAQQRKNTTSQAPKLKFNRVEISAKMKDITEHLKPVCAKVSNILNLEFMGTSRITKKDIAKKRPITTSDITENQVYGRDVQKKRIVDNIIHGNYFANNELAVLPIVGPGGIGKTTFTQHVYEEVKGHFEVAIWICVSLNFNANDIWACQEEEWKKTISTVWKRRRKR